MYVFSTMSSSLVYFVFINLKIILASPFHEKYIRIFFNYIYLYKPHVVACACFLSKLMSVFSNIVVTFLVRLLTIQPNNHSNL